VRFGMAETPSTPTGVPWLATDQMSGRGDEGRKRTREEQVRSMVVDVLISEYETCLTGRPARQDNNCQVGY
jgi:hypothetical protein